MSALDFIALIFAASAIVDAWRNAELLAGFRAYFEAREDNGLISDDPDETRVNERLAEAGPIWAALLDVLCPKWVASILNCAYCLSHHTPWIAAGLMLWPASLLDPPWAFLLKIPVYSLAATRIGNIINAVVPTRAKYERGDPEFLNTSDAADDEEDDGESG